MGGLRRKYAILPESWTQVVGFRFEVMQNENLQTLPVSLISLIYLEYTILPFRLISYGLVRTPDLRSNLSMG